MKIPTATWLSGAAALLLAGFVQNSADLMIAAAVVGSLGVGTRLIAAWIERKDMLVALPPRDSPLEVLDLRLREAERALEAATSQLASLRGGSEPLRRDGREPGSPLLP